MSQNRRVLKVLRRHPEGVCQAEFLLPNVIDGGHPITRLAARIRDLKDEGHEIIVDGERYSTAVYKLVLSDREPAPAPEPVREFIPMDEHAKPDPLFDLPPNNAILGEEAA